MEKMEIVQSILKEENIDAWIIYNYRNFNPIFSSFIGEEKSITRRVYLLVSQVDSPQILCHQVDSELFNNININIIKYKDWHELHLILEKFVKNNSRIALEYSEENAIPSISYVDAGTYELLKKFGATLSSSAKILQKIDSGWGNDGYNLHKEACIDVENIKNLAFSYISDNLSNDITITEYDVQQFIMSEFSKRNMETEDLPIVAVGQNSGIPHYEPSKEHCKVIEKNNLILIDLWAKYKVDNSIYSDITWMGYTGKDIPEKYIKIFKIVQEARDSVVNYLKITWKDNKEIKGYELDDIARNIIKKSGYDNYFTHRTGHSIGPGYSLHALGVNLDNYETHDDRILVSDIGFSVEPGIYLEEFGIRLEIDVYIHPINGPIVTTNIQNSIISL